MANKYLKMMYNIINNYGNADITTHSLEWLNSKRLHFPSVDRNVGKLELSFTTGRHANSTSTMEKS